MQLTFAFNTYSSKISSFKKYFNFTLLNFIYSTGILRKLSYSLSCSPQIYSAYPTAPIFIEYPSVINAFLTKPIRYIDDIDHCTELHSTLNSGNIAAVTSWMHKCCLYFQQAVYGFKMAAASADVYFGK
jgi:hypothetical protein